MARRAAAAKLFSPKLFCAFAVHFSIRFGQPCAHQRSEERTAHSARTRSAHCSSHRLLPFLPLLALRPSLFASNPTTHQPWLALAPPVVAGQNHTTVEQSSMNDGACVHPCARTARSCMIPALPPPRWISRIDRECFHRGLVTHSLRAAACCLLCIVLACLFLFRCVPPQLFSCSLSFVLVGVFVFGVHRHPRKPDTAQQACGAPAGSCVVRATSAPCCTGRWTPPAARTGSPAEQRRRHAVWSGWHDDERHGVRNGICRGSPRYRWSVKSVA